MSLNPPDEPRDLSIPDGWKGDPPTLEADETAEPETRVHKGRTITGEEPIDCIHGIPLQRGYWCGDCRDLSTRAQSLAEKQMRDRHAAEQAERMRRQG